MSGSKAGTASIVAIYFHHACPVITCSRLDILIEDHDDEILTSVVVEYMHCQAQLHVYYGMKTDDHPDKECCVSTSGSHNGDCMFGKFYLVPPAIFIIFQFLEM